MSRGQKLDRKDAKKQQFKMIAQKNKIWLPFPFSVVISCNNSRDKKIVLMSTVLDYFNCKPTIIVIQHNRINGTSDVS